MTGRAHSGRSRGFTRNGLSLSFAPSLFSTGYDPYYDYPPFCRPRWSMFGDDTSVNLNLGQGFQFPKGMTQASYITRQVNRFAGVRTPQAFPVPLTNTVASVVAFWAAALYNEAVQAAAAAGTADATDVARAFQSSMDPVPWLSANQAAVAAAITGYADAMKMPPAVGVGPSSVVMAAVVVGAAILALAIFKGGVR